MASYTGGCTCGAIRYEVTAEPVRSFQCQCRDKPQSVPDLIGVYVGTLDDPSGFEPEIVMFASRGHSWDHLDPALPKVPQMRPSS